jgi:5S rRNA maturation endonuclease (ribonuclease M5)
LKKKRVTQLPHQKWTEKMEAILHDLVSDANTGTPIIVEGPKDEVALRALGIQGPIHCVHNGIRLFEVAEQLAHYKRIILLTDFDDQGEKLSKKLRSNLETMRCKVDLEHRSKMKQVFRRLTKDVESLSSVVSRLQLPSQYALYQD